jgi:hypothetical protein
VDEALRPSLYPSWWRNGDPDPRHIEPWRFYDYAPLEDPRRCGACDGIGEHVADCPVASIVRVHPDYIDARQARHEEKERRKARRRMSELTAGSKTVLKFTQNDVTAMLAQAREWRENPEQFENYIMDYSLVWLQVANQLITTPDGVGPADVARLLTHHSALVERLRAKLTGKSAEPEQEPTLRVRHGEE